MPLIPLSHCLNQRANHVVAVKSGEKCTNEEFLLRVKGWCDALGEKPGSRWALYHSDTYEFLCILCALWQLGRTACIPSDNRPGTVKRLVGSVDGLVGEFPASATVILEPAGHSSIEMQWIIPEPDFIALEIYTSGSTGDPKSIVKTIAQLEREVEILESLWPTKADCVVLATVSHQHIYGMTFGLFWPFSSGRAFETTACEFPEDILYKSSCYPCVSLISSPSHLSRMSSSLDWADMATQCSYVVSSAAPLAREDSLNVSRLLDAPVREIYGSSETGAIAWRIQQPGDIDTLWRALPEVSLEPTGEGSLLLKSPYLGDLDSFELPDQVEFDHHGHFKLLGRVDRIVKVEGKRISLTSVERLLLENERVKNVKALTIERVRVETAIVMQLSHQGKDQLRNEGRRSLINYFRNLLADSFEAVVLPRRWRFVEEMPFNRQGKLPLESLEALFAKDECKWPQIFEEQVTEGKVVMRCYVPEELIYFDGHMADRPILPGIVQVHWAEAFGRKLLSVQGRFERLEVVKFQRVILPQYLVTIFLDYNDSNNKLNFRFESEKGVHSSGRICFAL